MRVSVNDHRTPTRHGLSIPPTAVGGNVDPRPEITQELPVPAPGRPRISALIPDGRRAGGKESGRPALSRTFRRPWLAGDGRVTDRGRGAQAGPAPARGPGLTPGSAAASPGRVRNSPRNRSRAGNSLGPQEPGRGGDPRHGERGEVPVLDGSIVQPQFGQCRSLHRRLACRPARRASLHACTKATDGAWASHCRSAVSLARVITRRCTSDVTASRRGSPRPRTFAAGGARYGTATSQRAGLPCPACAIVAATTMQGGWGHGGLLSFPA